MTKKIFPHFKGFTLIELLIVVAIIAILAAIAVPNFLEAQTRSKVSRVKADFRSYATAIESYMVETNHYPNGRSSLVNPVQANDGSGVWFSGLNELTTPIAYITKIDAKEPFLPLGKFEPFLGGATGGNTVQSYLYYNLGNGYGPDTNPTPTGWSMHPNRTWAERTLLDDVVRLKGWVLASVGPNRYEADLVRAALGTHPNDPSPNSPTADFHGVSNLPRSCNRIYDPTNGTISDGDIGRAGGESRDGRALLINGSGTGGK